MSEPGRACCEHTGRVKREVEKGEEGGRERAECGASWSKRQPKHFRCHCTAFRLSCSQQPKHNTQEEASFSPIPFPLAPCYPPHSVTAELLVSLKLESLALAYADAERFQPAILWLLRTSK